MQQATPCFQAFDSAIRGLPLGEVAKMEAKGGEWNQELLFNVSGHFTHLT